MSERGSFTTSIRKDILDGFRGMCKKNNLYINDVLEAFMSGYIEGKFVFENNLRVVGIDRFGNFESDDEVNT